MNKIKLTEEEKNFINDMRNSALKYASKGHELAVKDLNVINKFLEGLVTVDFTQILVDNIDQIQTGLYRFNSESQAKSKIMEALLSKIKRNEV